MTKPSSGNEYGRCEICGKTALPKYGVFLCTKHATFERAMQVKRRE